jgi:hypothetical protein
VASQAFQPADSGRKRLRRFHIDSLPSVDLECLRSDLKVPKQPKTLPKRPIQEGDRVHRDDTPSIWIVLKVYDNGCADINLEGTELDWFKIPVTRLTLIEEK